MSRDNRLDDYVDVAHRIKLFYERYPDGSLQMDPVLEFKELGDQLIVIGRAYAFRNPDDDRPGVGTAQEFLPGKTSFTRGSEIQNLETSCWGRAIGSLGIGIDKRIATREEVELAIERNVPDMEVRTVQRGRPKRIVELLNQIGVSGKDDVLEAVKNLIERDIESSQDLTASETEDVIFLLEQVTS